MKTNLLEIFEKIANGELLLLLQMAIMNDRMDELDKCVVKLEIFSKIRPCCCLGYSSFGERDRHWTIEHRVSEVRGKTKQNKKNQSLFSLTL